MKPTEIQQLILKCLKSQKLGSSQVKIAENTGLSRPTVAKYLEILEGEGKVTTIDVGGFSLWTSTQTDNVNPKFATLYFDFMKFSLKAIDEEYRDIDWKKIGRKMSQSIETRDFVRTEKLEKFLEGKNPIALLKIDNLKSIIREIFITVCKIFNLGSVERPIVVKNPPIIIIRIVNAESVEIQPFYWMLAGLFEKKMEEEFKVLKMDISAEIYPPESDQHGNVDFTIKILK